MLRYDDLQVFVHTSDSGSLSAAARQLEISPAVASAALKRLESELEVRLFARSTRSLRLTPEGDAYLQLAFQALQRRAGHRRGNLQLARGGGQRAAVAGVDEHLEVVVTQHFQDSFERVFPDSLFFSDLK